jgi:hypothetical protein
MSSLASRLLAGNAAPQWRINRRHPLARGLVRYLLPAATQLVDLATGSVYATRFGAPLPSATIDGIANRTNGTVGANYWTVPRRTETVGSFTIYFRGTFHAFQSSTGSNVVRNGETFLGVASPGALRKFIRRVGAAERQSAASAALDTNYGLGLTSAGPIYLNGQQLAPDSDWTVSTTALGATWTIGRNGTSTQSADISLAAVLIWDRALSDAEMLLLNSQWQDLAEPPFDFRALMRAPAGGGGVTLTPARATHALPADPASITSITSLLVAQTHHSQTADQAVLLLPGQISAARAAHVLSSDAAALTVLAALAPSDTHHALVGPAAQLVPSGGIQPSGRVFNIASDGRVTSPERDLRRTDIPLS